MGGNKKYPQKDTHTKLYSHSKHSILNEKGYQPAHREK